MAWCLMAPSVLETKAGLSVRDRQLWVRTSNFLHISLQIDVWISQNSDQDTGNFFSLALNTGHHPFSSEFEYFVEYITSI